jgi:hypothetical protein
MGQACVFYGAAEFSRDLDLLVLADGPNLADLRRALDELSAEVIAIPHFDPNLLVRGHAVHFRCRREDVDGLRIDLMSALRGVDGFDELWERRTTIETEGEAIDLLAIEDLVRAKKTQRDKDWPMIRRLVEQSYFSRGANPARAQVEFWMRELRTPELLVEAAARHRELALAEGVGRPAVLLALDGKLEEVAAALEAEEREEHRRDRDYWAPLKRELEEMRLGRNRG